jgi:hypothetical protein
MFFIYRLTDGEQDYYGQTQYPDKRLSCHKCPTNSCRSKLLDKSKMELHIIHRLYTQQEADETEAFYQLNFDCVNFMVTGRTSKEYNQSRKQKTKEYNKEYRQEHKEEIKERDAKYYQDNKEKIIEQQKKYNQEHKEEITERTAKYYQENKDKLLEYQVNYRLTNKEKIETRHNKKHECECGGRYTYSHKAEHFRSKKHQDWWLCPERYTSQK